jgi:hypothetical protein
VRRRCGARAARLPVREVGALTQLRHRELDRADARVPVALAVAPPCSSSLSVSTGPREDDTVVSHPPGPAAAAPRSPTARTPQQRRKTTSTASYTTNGDATQPCGVTYPRVEGPHEQSDPLPCVVHVATLGVACHARPPSHPAQIPHETSPRIPAADRTYPAPATSMTGRVDRRSFVAAVCTDPGVDACARALSLRVRVCAERVRGYVWSAGRSAGLRGRGRGRRRRVSSRRRGPVARSRRLR